jgi:hypothetical protein
MSRGLGFVVTLFNLVMWVYFHRHFAPLLPKPAQRLRWLSPAVFVIAFHPALVLLLAGRPGVLVLRRSSPSFISMVAMAVQFAAWASIVALLCLTLVRLLFRLVRALKAKPAVSAPVARIERRRLMAQATSWIPAGALTTSAAGVWASRQTPVVSRVRLPVRRELTNLHGLKLVQVSDVHVGSYMDAARLNEIARVMNALRADVPPGEFAQECKDRSVRLIRPAAHESARAEAWRECGAHQRRDLAAIIAGGQLRVARVQIHLGLLRG